MSFQCAGSNEPCLSIRSVFLLSLPGCRDSPRVISALGTGMGKDVVRFVNDGVAWKICL